MGLGTNYWVTDNFIGHWLEGGAAFTGWGNTPQNVVCIDAIFLSGPIIRGNVITADTLHSLDTLRNNGNEAALKIQSCLEPLIEGNSFINWRNSVSPLTDECVALTGINVAPRFVRNVFFGCGGANIVAIISSVTALPVFEHNFFSVGLVGTLFGSAVSLLSGTTTLIHFVGNYWNYVGADGAQFALRADAGVSSGGMISANFFLSGNIFVTSAGGTPFGLLRGYAPVDSAGDTFAGLAGDPNNVLGYT